MHWIFIVTNLDTDEKIVSLNSKNLAQRLKIEHSRFTGATSLGAHAVSTDDKQYKIQKIEFVK